ncbi:methyl-accepting chemotaxis protein [Tateyamaria sp. ANG-S1]|uniref:methyl-accepting chemotaxis protein n=1 Tax=Tateyamaria sp. ANG-S1 TaxID=1577905 RepID=UPI0012698F77|nr:methyl-accepting chemotaxis protein [Tateyamaria sp. ANG-S1]
MFDDDCHDPAASDAPLTRLLQLQCRALAAVPDEFRAVGTWLNYDCALLPHLDSEEDRARILEDMQLARVNLMRVMQYFDVSAEIPGYHTDALTWFRDCLGRAPQKSDPFRVTANMLFELHDKVQSDPVAAKAMHRDVSQYILMQFAPEFMSLMKLLKAEEEAQEQVRIQYAERMRAKADAAIADIKSVSKMVRLISLNASVEAARAGEAGRAFGVIASEVKAMSESIQTSASTVTATVRDLTDRI